MDTISAFGFESCCKAIAGDMARALAERSGETPQQQFVRNQAAAYMIMGFLPRDVAEALLASHCVMFHELMVVGVHDALCAQDAKARRAEVQGLLAMNKAFGGSLTHLQRYQKRVPEGRPQAGADRDAACNAAAATVPPGPAPASTSAVPQGPAPASAPAAPAAAHLSPVAKPAPAAGSSAPRALSESYRPTHGAVAASGGNSAAAALKPGSVAGLAQPTGIEQRGAVFVAAAGTPESPFPPDASGPWADGSGRDKQKP